jgi:polar amino acid transport system substrate-binding protein
VVRKSIFWLIALLVLVVLCAAACGSDSIASIDQLEGKVFAVPEGTVADQLVLSRFSGARFKYYASALEACMAVKQGEADAAAYDQPILKNIAAKNEGLTVLPDMITVDNYGFAVALDKGALKSTVDQVVRELKANGTYDKMLTAWLPEKGAPAGTQPPVLTGTAGVLIFGTAAVTEPVSYLGTGATPIGFDIDLAAYIAGKLGYRLQIVNMAFGDLIPALVAGEVDMIGACITITNERAKSVLFSEPYYRGGIAALVKE